MTLPVEREWVLWEDLSYSHQLDYLKTGIWPDGQDDTIDTISGLMKELVLELLKLHGQAFVRRWKPVIFGSLGYWTTSYMIKKLEREKEESFNLRNNQTER